MADPFTLIAAGVSAAGSIMEGNAGYSQGMYESGVAAENARRSRENAAQIRLAGQMAEEAKRREIRRSLGRSAAAISQAGIGAPGTGSAGAAFKQAATEAELDALNLRYGYQSDAYGQDVEALNYDAESKAARRRARAARKAGFMNAAGDIFGGFANYSGARAQRSAMRSPGVVASSGRGGRIPIGIQRPGP